MKKNFLFDGAKFQTSSKGTDYAKIYLRELDDFGSPVMEQTTFISFNPNVIQKAKSINAGESIIADLKITQATIEDLEV